jgi:TolA-binding protein
MSLKKTDKNEKARLAFEQVLELSPDTEVARQAELELQELPATK